MFYKVPARIFNPVKERGLITGNILVVNDVTNQLSNQIQGDGIQITSVSLEDLIEGTFWAQCPEIDWLVCITQGLGKKTELVIDAGCSVTKKGLCLLDRLSFLEPTRGREPLLTSKTLRNLIVLSPRPSFRADSKQLKDSMTSAWYIFRTNSNSSTDTNIEFDVNWDRPQMLSRGQQNRGNPE